MDRNFIFTFVLLIFSFGLFGQSTEEISRSLAEEQLQAYNARDIEAFLVPYSDSVKI